jgi:hypothetical protein
MMPAGPSCSDARRGIVACSVVLLVHAAGGALSFAAAADERVTMRVEFLANGQCMSSMTGSDFPGASLSAAQAPIALRSEYRCPVSWRSHGQAVTLTVLLPAGEAPAGADFPRLMWITENGRWVGAAKLPSGPAFVRVARAGSPAVTRARLLDCTALIATAIAIVWTIVYSVRTSRWSGA